MPPSQLDRIEEKIDRIEGRLEGDGSESNPGLIVRVDRLEQTHRLVKWFAGTTIGAALTTLVTAAVALFRNHH